MTTKVLSHEVTCPWGKIKCMTHDASWCYDLTPRYASSSRMVLVTSYRLRWWSREGPWLVYLQSCSTCMPFRENGVCWVIRIMAVFVAVAASRSNFHILKFISSNEKLTSKSVNKFASRSTWKFPLQKHCLLVRRDPNYPACTVFAKGLIQTDLNRQVAASNCIKLHEATCGGGHHTVKSRLYTYIHVFFHLWPTTSMLRTNYHPQSCTNAS